MSQLGNANDALGMNTTTVSQASQILHAGEKAATKPLSDIGSYILYGFAFLGGGLLLITGLILIGADVGLGIFARTKVAATGQKTVSAIGGRKERRVQAERNTRTSARAEQIAESKRRSQEHREALTAARVKTEQAKATAVRSKTKVHRQTQLIKANRIPTGKTPRPIYISGDPRTREIPF